MSCALRYGPPAPAEDAAELRSVACTMHAPADMPSMIDIGMVVAGAPVSVYRHTEALARASKTAGRGAIHLDMVGGCARVAASARSTVDDRLHAVGHRDDHTTVEVGQEIERLEQRRPVLLPPARGDRHDQAAVDAVGDLVVADEQRHELVHAEHLRSLVGIGPEPQAEGVGQQPLGAVEIGVDVAHPAPRTAGRALRAAAARRRRVRAGPARSRPGPAGRLPARGPGTPRRRPEGSARRTTPTRTRRTHRAAAAPASPRGAGSARSATTPGRARGSGADGAAGCSSGPDVPPGFARHRRCSGRGRPAGRRRRRAAPAARAAP